MTLILAQAGVPNYDLVEFKGKAVFQADDGVHGVEVWVTDGTPQGTRILVDFAPGPAFSHPILFRWRDTLYVTFNPNSGSSLWRTDGTPDGTVKLLDAGNGAYYWTPGDSVVYYTDYGTNALWKTNGVRKTQLFTYPSNASLGGDFVTVGDRLFFFIRDLSTEIFSLWTSDGTPPGTKMLKQFDRVDSLRRAGELLLFEGTASQHGQELWRSDGTVAGTFLVRDILPGPESGGVWPAITVGDTVYFRSFAMDGPRLFKSDGSAEGTVMIQPPSAPELRASGSPLAYFDANGTLYFAAEDNEHGEALWKSDGTDAGTMLVADVSSDDYPDYRLLGYFRDELYFSVDDGPHGRELWKTDGTPAGTFLIAEIVPGPGGSDPDNVVLVNRRLIIFATTPQYGREPWVLENARLTTPASVDLSPKIAADANGTLLQDGSEDVLHEMLS